MKQDCDLTDKSLKCSSYDRRVNDDIGLCWRLAGSIEGRGSVLCWPVRVLLEAKRSSRLRKQAVHFLLTSVRLWLCSPNQELVACTTEINFDDAGFNALELI